MGKSAEEGIFARMQFGVPIRKVRGVKDERGKGRREWMRWDSWHAPPPPS